MNQVVVVIGAGLGGMSAAISLAAKGAKVTLLEKNDHLGGKLNLHEEQGFSFDMGPSIFTLPQYFDSLFERVNKKRSDYFQIQPVEPHWRNFFADGTTVDLSMNREKTKSELAKLSTDAPAEFDRFMEYSKKNYDLIAEGYFDQGLDTEWEMLKHYGPLKMMFKMDSAHTMAKSTTRFFTDQRMQDLFNFFIKYVGSSATNAPGFFNLMPSIQFDYDLWYVKGGLFEISRAFERLLKELDVKIIRGVEVDKILEKGKVVYGVQTKDKQIFEADIVVSNREVVPTYRDLLNVDPKLLTKMEKKFEPACSGLVVHLGTSKVYPQLAHHNFFYSENQAKHFATVFDKKEIPEDPTLYVVAPTRTDPSKAPVGKDNIKILPHIPYLHEERSFTQKDYNALKDRVIDKLVRSGLTDLREHIEYEHVWTPYDIEQTYGSHRGSVYGIVSDRSTNFGFKHPKTSKLFKNLYFVGGTTNPGAGMPMVVLSGQKVADRIEKHLHEGILQ